jgi:short-subunit dehydrogenase
MDPTQPKRLAVVTGASSGIGYELAKQFARHGFDLIIAAEDRGIVEARQAIAALGVAVEAIQVDLATFEGVAEFYRQIHADGRPVDALALNAGVGVSGDFARETDLKDELNLISLNVVSPVHLCKLVAKDMVAAGRGRILFTSSIASTAPGPFYAVYAASKAFIQSFAQAIRSELKDTGVTVTALMPGATDTNFFERAGMEDTRAGAGDKDDPAEVAAAGYEALMAGKDHVIAGAFKNKIQGVAAKILPETVTAAMQRRQTEPGSAPQP